MKDTKHPPHTAKYIFPMELAGPLDDVRNTTPKKYKTNDSTTIPISRIRPMMPNMLAMTARLLIPMPTPPTPTAYFVRSQVVSSALSQMSSLKATDVESKTILAVKSRVHCENLGPN
eukprot:CAMPEP_0197737600 /NCGR_PEP_ID=MMETSP1435-20131217/9915_1 /TAXON_ID=426625 /ORGANISM="Chaetoceros brevis, Strain CCMP164" /LENGTH=116 /DNA_ID=CAMNT_0043326173 /DNA_START=219 /DNA_END=569 /DNA_ORIENTATION=-